MTYPNLVDLTEGLADEVVQAYAAVFAVHPWYELERCTKCGRAYPGPVDDRPGEDRKAPYAPGDPCWGCNEPLHLVDYYLDRDDPRGEQIYREALVQDGFVGAAAATSRGRVVGFAWGYRVPPGDTTSVKFTEVLPLADSLGWNREATFYAAELGVVPALQGRGLGEQLARRRLEAARARGFERVCFRTVNERQLLSLYEKMFGSGVEKAFDDPDPIKNRPWFSALLSDLR
jgi:ribosomal protein S18 acetylase RimI-like enzyme